MLVGSIDWTAKEGQSVAKAGELGYFAYGGSTVIVIYPRSHKVVPDEDLITNSKEGTETLVRVGMHVGLRK